MNFPPESEEARLPLSDDERLLLAIDTCGPSGSVALGRLTDSGAEILGETTLEGRTYSATLVAAVEALLKAHKTPLRQVGAIIVVNGPGSFTGVRVGLSAAKGLAEGSGLPVVALSRLAVLAAKSGVADAALDAHRHEIYFRLGEQELLAGAEELAARIPARSHCRLRSYCRSLAGWRLAGAGLVRVAEPLASETILLAAARVRASQFDDIALLDGHYLRRSDAEIFGEKGRPAATGGSPAR